MGHVEEDVVLEITGVGLVVDVGGQTVHGLLLLGRLVRCEDLLQAEPVAAEHGVDELEVRELVEHAGVDLAADSCCLGMDAAELTTQNRVIIEVLEGVLAGGVVHDGRNLHVVQDLHVGLEQLVVEEAIAIAASELHADHAEVLDAVLELVDVFLAAERRKNGVGNEAAFGALAHLGGLLVHDLAHVEGQPFLPHRHAQHRDVDASLVHCLDLGLERIVAVNVVQDLLAFGVLKDDLVLRTVRSLAQISLHAEGDRRGVQKAVKHLFVGEQVGRQEVHVIVDNASFSHFLSFFVVGCQ